MRAEETWSVSAETNDYHRGLMHGMEIAAESILERDFEEETATNLELCTRCQRPEIEHAFKVFCP